MCKAMTTNLWGARHGAQPVGCTPLWRCYKLPSSHGENPVGCVPVWLSCKLSTQPWWGQHRWCTMVPNWLWGARRRTPSKLCTTSFGARDGAPPSKFFTSSFRFRSHSLRCEELPLGARDGAPQSKLCSMGPGLEVVCHGGERVTGAPSRGTNYSVPVLVNLQLMRATARHLHVRSLTKHV